MKEEEAGEKERGFRPRNYLGSMTLVNHVYVKVVTAAVLTY